MQLKANKIILLVTIFFLFFSIANAEIVIQQTDFSESFSSNQARQTILCDDVVGNSIESVDLYDTGDTVSQLNIANAFIGNNLSATLDASVTGIHTYVFSPAIPINVGNCPLGQSFSLTNYFKTFADPTGSGTFFGGDSNPYVGGSCTEEGCEAVSDVYFVINNDVAEITGLRFISPSVADSTAVDLGANVSGSIGSIFPVVLLSIAVFLTFYIIQRVMFMFSGVERAILPRKRRGRKK